MAALISSVMNTKDRVPFYVNACDELGIEVLPPDVNESQTDFAVVDGKIRFGLNAVKNVGELGRAAIVRAREEGGPFDSIWDFTERVDPPVVNKRALESLVKCGGFDSTGARARGCSPSLEQALAYGQKRRPGPARRARARSSTASTSRAARSRQHPPIPVRRVREARAAAAREGDARPLRLRAPAARAARPAAAQDRRAIAELERRRDGEIVASAGSSARSSS